MSQTFTPSQIDKILDDYKLKKEREYKYYHTVKKFDDGFILKNRERARNHYNENKEQKKLRYEGDKEFIKCRSLYNYYKKKDNLEKFQTKYPDKMELLNNRGIY